MEKKKDIKIFVSHRIDLDSETIDNPLFVPVRCGAVFDKRENITMLGDNTGDNISEKRMSFCELTVQYWAWKNVEADYYGLCHYRRYLSFSDKEYNVGKEERNNGCIVENYLTEKVISEYCLDEIHMRNLIENNDVIVCKPIKANKTNLEAMKDSPDYHNMEDMYKTIEIVNKLYPEMKDIVDEYMNSKVIRLYNCFIMKREIFQQYSEWLFNILFELEKNIDMSKYGLQKYRTPGTIGERLFGIYCLYLQRNKNVKIIEQQLIFIEHTEKQNILNPAWNKEQITIVSNFNNNYADIFSVFLISALEYFSQEKQYEFIILSEDLTLKNKEILKGIISQYENVKISFYNPFAILDDIKLFVDNNVYSKDLYVRTIIPYILKNYDKTIVIDADTICKIDLSKLYNYDINNYSIAAVRDIVYAGYLNGVVKGTLEYCQKYMKLSNPYNYCNTGVIILNCKKIRQKYSLEYVLKHINTHEYKIYEQDMINVLFDKDILFLDPTWNLFTYTNSVVEKAIKFAPMKDYVNYQEARKNPKIIHYAAHPKPWWCNEADFSIDFWYTARKSPFYEKLLAQVAWFQANNIINTEIFKESFPRRVSNILLPKGTKRRELLKKVVPKNSLVWNISKKIYYTLFSR